MMMTRTETPERVHGRLLEAVHIAGYTFERACDQLKWLLRQERWKSVGPGYNDIDAFLATLDFSALRASRDARKDIVRQLAAIHAGQRATARMLGVSVATVHEDINPGVRNRTPKPNISKQDSEEPAQSPDLDVQNRTLSITPYYSDAGITIYHGDAREIIPTLERGLMVTDPPYNVDYHYDGYDDAKSDDEYWALLTSVLRMPLVVIHYPENLFPITKHFCRRSPDKVVAWVYHANTPRQWRAIGWFGVAPDLTLDGQPYRNPDDRRIRALIAQGREARLYDWWEHEQVKNVSSEKTEHPCQIPRLLMRRVLRVTPFDGPVIDPFCGSGSTLLAAQELGRRAIGIDCSEQYCEVAANRLRQQSLALVT